MARGSAASVTQALLAALLDTAEEADHLAGVHDWPRRAGLALAAALLAAPGAEPITHPARFGQAAERLLRHLAPGSRLVDAAADRVVLALPAPPIGSKLLTARERVIRAAVGGLAARHFGRAAVRLEPRVADQGPEWRVTCWLGPDASEGERFLAADLDALARPRAEEPGQQPSGERLQELGQLAVGVAHGLNNVLGAIASQAAWLEQAVSDPAQAEQLGSIRQAAADGSAMLRRVLRMSRGQPTTSAADLELLDLDEVVREAARLVPGPWRGGPDRRGGAVRLAIERGAPARVRGVGADLREAVVNLATNALDAMAQGGTLTLRTDRVEGRAVLECRDTGPGMAPAVRDRVFEPFFTTKGDQGTGMGLPIVYAIAARHGGEARLETEPGVGTTVTLILPAVEPEAGALDPPPAPDLDGGEPPTLAILVVDDDRAFRNAFARRLMLDGHRVATAADGGEALEQAQASAFDLICVDERLPDAAGTDLARQLRQRQPGACIALVSGFAAQVDDAALHADAIDAVLPKPCKDAELEAVLRRAGGRAP